MSKDHNTKQDLAILGIQKDVSFILQQIKEIKENHLHNINEEIKCLNTEITKLKDNLNRRPTWAITLLISFTLAMFSFILANFLL